MPTLPPAQFFFFILAFSVCYSLASPRPPLLHLSTRVLGLFLLRFGVFCFANRASSVSIQPSRQPHRARPAQTLAERAVCLRILRACWISGDSIVFARLVCLSSPSRRISFSSSLESDIQCKRGTRRQNKDKDKIKTVAFRFRLSLLSPTDISFLTLLHLFVRKRLMSMLILGSKLSAWMKEKYIIFKFYYIAKEISLVF